MRSEKYCHAENHYRLCKNRNCPRDVRARRICSGHLRKLRKVLKGHHVFHLRRPGSIFPIGPRPRSRNMQGAPTRFRKSGNEIDQEPLTRTQLLRLRLQSPARRRDASAEWPGPGTVMSALDRPRQHALQPPLQPLHGSHLHQVLPRQLEIQRYRLRKACCTKCCAAARAWHNCVLVAASRGLSQGLRTGAC